jgi:hypothetical protein
MWLRPRMWFRRGMHPCDGDGWWRADNRWMPGPHRPQRRRRGRDRSRDHLDAARSGRLIRLRPGQCRASRHGELGAVAEPLVRRLGHRPCDHLVDRAGQLRRQPAGLGPRRYSDDPGAQPHRLPARIAGAHRHRRTDPGSAASARSDGAAADDRQDRPCPSRLDRGSARSDTRRTPHRVRVPPRASKNLQPTDNALQTTEQRNPVRTGWSEESQLALKRRAAASMRSSVAVSAIRTCSAPVGP